MEGMALGKTHSGVIVAGGKYTLSCGDPRLPGTAAGFRFT